MELSTFRPTLNTFWEITEIHSSITNEKQYVERITTQHILLLNQAIILLYEKLYKTNKHQLIIHDRIHIEQFV